MADRYSIEQLAGSLFAPFRQLDTGPVGGALTVRLRAWVDRLVSRFIGAGIRLVMIVIGLIVFVVSSLFGLVWLAIWPLLPLLPVIGFGLTWSGWLPGSPYV